MEVETMVFETETAGMHATFDDPVVEQAPTGFDGHRAILRYGA
jgi:hypothetical protein